MKGFIEFFNHLLGRQPTRQDKSYAKKELDYFLRGFNARPYLPISGQLRKRVMRKTTAKVGDVEVVGKVERLRDAKK